MPKRDYDSDTSQLLSNDLMSTSWRIRRNTRYANFYRASFAPGSLVLLVQCIKVRVHHTIAQVVGYKGQQVS